MKRQFISYAGISILFAVGGCASSQHATDGQTFTRTTNGATVNVTEDEYKIHMPTAFPGGIVTFHITNTGSHTHSFKIEGNGIEQQLPSDLASGTTADMTVSLTPGVYDVDCPVFGHSQMGMRLSVTVTQ